jgi:hypothetical protein
MLSERPGLEWRARAYSAAERAKPLLGRGAKLTFEDTWRIAGLATGGLREAGDPYYEQGLRCALAAAHNADLTGAGRRAVSDRLWPGLAKRLKLVRQQRLHREVFQRPLQRPFLVMGLARSGTTHLHRLLALDDRFDALPLWELNDPFPPEDGPDRRRELAWENFGTTADADVDHIHYMDPDTPEECSILQMSQFVSGLFWGAAPLYDYAEWLLELDGALDRKVYSDYRDQLLWMQSQHAGKALALKAPDHTGRIGVIAELIPEAMVVNTVRDPVKVVNSSNSLVYQYHRMTARRIDVRRMSELNLRLVESMWHSHRDGRGPSVIDVRYDDIVQRPIEAVRSIYEFHGVDWPEGHDATLQAYLDANPQRKHGGHTYSSQDFGLTDDGIERRFADYYDYFGVRRER